MQGRVKGEGSAGGGPGVSGAVGGSEAGVAVGGSAGVREGSVLLWGGIMQVGLGTEGPGELNAAGGPGVLLQLGLAFVCGEQHL